MLYEINARGCLIQRHVDQIRLRVDDHTPYITTEIIPVNKEPEVPTMLPANTERAFPNKLNENLSPVSTSAIVHSSVTSPVMKDHPTHPATPERHSSNPKPGDVRNGANASTDSSAENVLRRSTRIKEPTKFFGIND